jgi:hypothetical protein
MNKKQKKGTKNFTSFLFPPFSQQLGDNIQARREYEEKKTNKTVLI